MAGGTRRSASPIEARTTAAQALALALEQRDAAAEALLSDRQGWVEGQRPQELLWTDRHAQRHPDRGGEGPHAVALDRADHLSRREPAAPERQLPGPDPAHAGRSAEPRGGGQGQPGRGRLLRPARGQEPAQELRARGSRGPDPDRVRPTSGCGGTTAAPSSPTTTSASCRCRRRARAWTSAATRRRWCAAARRRATRSTSCHRPRWWRREDDEVAFNAAVELSWAAVDDAAGYWLEVAHDPGFRRMVAEPLGPDRRSATIRARSTSAPTTGALPRSTSSACRASAPMPGDFTCRPT